MRQQSSILFQLLGVLLLTFIAFAPSLSGTYLNWDDTIYIRDNPLLSQPVSFKVFVDLYNYDQFISLVLFSFLLQFKILGESPFMIHLLNLFFHLVNVVLVYIFVKKLFHNTHLAVIIALLFALHPMKAESVCWMIQRKDIFLGMFSFAALLSYLNFLTKRQILMFILVFLFSYLAVLSKIQAYALIPVFFLLEYFVKKKISSTAVFVNLSIFLMMLATIEQLEAWFFLVFLPLFLLIFRHETDGLLLKILPEKQFKNFKIKIFQIHIPVNTFIVILIIALKLIADNFSSIFRVPVNMGEFIYQLMFLWPVVLTGGMYLLPDVWKIRLQRSAQWWLALMLFLLTVVSAFIFLPVQLDFQQHFGQWQQFIYAFYSVNFYVLNYLFPFKLNAMHAYPDNVDVLPFAYLIAPIVFLVITAILIFILKKTTDKEARHRALFGLLFFLFNIFMVLHIIPIGGRVIVADRYTYVAGLGLIIFASAIIHYYFQKSTLKYKHRFLYIFVGLIVISFFVQSYARAGLYKNDKTFWGAVVADAPDNHYAQYSLGLYYYEKGLYRKALEQYDKAIALYRGNFEYFSNRAACHVKLNNIEQAFHDFETTIQMQPLNYAAYYNRGVLFMKLGDLKNADIDVSIALKIKPDYPEALKTKAEIDRLVNSVAKDTEGNERSIELSEYFNQTGTDKAMRGEFEAALKDFDLALGYNPANIDALRNKGNVFAAMKRFIEAETAYMQVLNLKLDDPGAYLNLGNISHEQGKVEQACRYWETAAGMGLRDAEIMMHRFCR